MGARELSPTPQQIREARRNAGLTQEAMAARLGAAKSIVEKWEYGTRNMPWIKYRVFVQDCVVDGLLTPAQAKRLLSHASCDASADTAT